MPCKCSKQSRKLLQIATESPLPCNCLLALVVSAQSRTQNLSRQDSHCVLLLSPRADAATTTGAVILVLLLSSTTVLVAAAANGPFQQLPGLLPDPACLHVLSLW